MIKYKFKIFNFNAFSDFLYDLIRKYGLWSIRFHPDNRRVFSEFQLTHAAPGGVFSDEDGFINNWSKNTDKVRKVDIDYSTKDSPGYTGPERELKILIDLDKGEMIIETLKGISDQQVDTVLMNTMAELNSETRIMINVRKVFGFLGNLSKNVIVQVVALVVGTIIIYFLVSKGCITIPTP